MSSHGRTVEGKKGGKLPQSSPFIYFYVILNVRRDRVSVTQAGM